MRGTLLAVIIAFCLNLNLASQNYSWEAMYGYTNYEGVNGNVYAITSFRGKIVAAGKFSLACDIPVRNVAMWESSTNTWSALGLDLGINPGDTVRALEVYNNQLYAGGTFTTTSGAVNIARWNDTSWVAVGQGANGEVAALKVYGSTLVAGGEFDNIGNRIAAWNGSTWSQIGGGFNLNNGSRVLALTIYNSNLVAAGRFNTAGGIRAINIATWNGNNWSSLSDSTNERIHAVTVHNGELYAGGRFTVIGGVSANFIARYNGLNWSALAGGNLDDRVFAIVSYSPMELVVGGQFKNILNPNLYVNYVAKWNGSSWSRMITGMDEKVTALYKTDTTIYAGGEFTIAGGLMAHHVARWFNRVTDTIRGTVRYVDNNQLVDSGRVLAVRRDYFTNEVVVVDTGRVRGGVYDLIRPPIHDTLRVLIFPDDELDFVPTYYPSTIDWKTAGLVVPGQNTNNIDINVYRISPAPQSSLASVVRGTIHLNVIIPLDPPGSYPYRSSSVLYVRQGNSFKRFATSGSNENYLTSLNPGTYELFAYRLGYCQASANLTINTNTTDTIVNFVLDTCSVIGIQNIGSQIPKDYLLKQNYPNPFNPFTTIGFSLPADGFAELKIYDVLGREIASLVNERLNKGEYKYVYDAAHLPSGIYFYRLIIRQSEGDPSLRSGFTETKKMVLIK